MGLYYSSPLFFHPLSVPCVSSPWYPPFYSHVTWDFCTLLTPRVEMYLPTKDFFFLSSRKNTQPSSDLDDTQPIHTGALHSSHPSTLGHYIAVAAIGWTTLPPKSQAESTHPEATLLGSESFESLHPK